MKAESERPQLKGYKEGQWMKFFKELLKKNWAPYTIASCSAVLLYLALTNVNVFLKGLSAVYSIMLPVLSGIIISYVMNPLVQFIHKKVFGKIKSDRLGRNLSVFVSVLMVVALIGLLMGALIPQMIDSIGTFADNFESYSRSLQKLFKSFMDRFGKENDLALVDQIWSQIVEKGSKLLSENMGEIIGTSYSIGKGFVSGIIACILAVYFLLDAPHLMECVAKLLRVLTTEKKYKNITDFVKRCNHILLRFIICDLIEGVIVGVVNFIFMSIVGMDYALLISVVVGVTNMAPTFGPIVGAVVGAFILVLVNPWYALWFLIFTVILQTIDGYIIKPKLFGDTLGVSSIWILITLVVGGRMFGVAGILLAIPFAAICDYIFRDIVWKRLEQRSRKRELMEKKNSKK